MTHAAVMWPIIPPVVCGLFAAYFFHGFYLLLHFIDFKALGEELVEKIDAAYKINPQAILPPGAESDMMVDFGHSDASQQFMTEVQRHMRAQRAWEFLLRDLTSTSTAAQKRLSSTCLKLSPVTLHLFFFSWAQVLVIIENFNIHMRGALEDVPYVWEWHLQDVFHLGAGLFFIGCVLVLGTRLTNNAKRAVARAVGRLVELKADTNKVALTSGLLGSRVVGFHLWGEPVNLGKCLPFTTAMVLLIFNTTWRVLTHKLNKQTSEFLDNAQQLLLLNASRNATMP